MKKEPSKTATAMKPRSSVSPAKQLARFIEKFDPAVARLVRSARAALRRKMPTAVEQVYDGYNFLAIGFCATERTSDCVVSLAVSAKGVALSFYHGALLADPAGILLGKGKQNRFVRLDDSTTLSRPEIVSLLRAAMAQARTPLSISGRGCTIIKSIADKQRSRRIKKV